jgi:hypothetical protein
MGQPFSKFHTGHTIKAVEFVLRKVVMYYLLPNGRKAQPGFGFAA